jgi:hypothetical protein
MTSRLPARRRGLPNSSQWQKLAYVYFEDELGGQATHPRCLLAKLPEL